MNQIREFVFLQLAAILIHIGLGLGLGCVWCILVLTLTLCDSSNVQNTVRSLSMNRISPVYYESLYYEILSQWGAVQTCVTLSRSAKVWHPILLYFKMAKNRDSREGCLCKFLRYIIIVWTNPDINDIRMYVLILFLWSFYIFDTFWSHKCS